MSDALVSLFVIVAMAVVSFVALIVEQAHNIRDAREHGWNIHDDWMP